MPAASARSTGSRSTCRAAAFSACSGPNGAGKSTLINILAGLVTKIRRQRHHLGLRHRRASAQRQALDRRGAAGDRVRSLLHAPGGAGDPGRALRHPQGGPADDGAAPRDAARGQGRRLCAHPLGRDEAAAAGRQGDGPFAADPGPRRADRRASTSSLRQQLWDLSSAASTRRASPSSSPPIISRKPSSSATGSRSSTTAG